MKEEGKHYCDTSKVFIKKINAVVAKKMIVKYHYTHSWSSCKYAIGIYYVDSSSDTFGDDVLIGCAIYGNPVGRSAAASVSDTLAIDSVLELTRLYIHDGYGSNIESYALGKTFKWIKENDPDIKALISYADASQAHLGRIYQATNWIYQGTNTDLALMPNYELSLQKNPYKWIHSRTVFSKWGSSNVDHLRREIGKQNITEFWRRIEASKHRYIQLIGNPRSKKNLKQLLKHPEKDYPKNSDVFMNEIHHHYTSYEKSSLNFW